MRKVCFLENGRSLTKCGHDSCDFFVKNRKKKGHPIDFFGPSYNVVLTELTFFYQIWAWQQMVFHEKIKKMTWEHSVFQRMDDFWIKYWYESIVFFGEWRFFWQNLGMRAVIFFVKNRKGRGSYWLFWPMI